MTPDEILLLQEAGPILIQNTIKLFIITLFLGMHLVLSFMAMHCVLKRQHRPLSTWPVLFTLFAITGLVISYVALQFTANIRLFYIAFVENPDEPLGVRFNIANQHILALNGAQTWMIGTNGLLYQIGDAVVIWRAWVIWPEKRKYLIIPMFFLVAGTALVITAGVLNTIPTLTGIIEKTSVLGTLGEFGLPLSLATNFVATVMIAIKTYQHRRVLGASFTKGKSFSERVLLLLTESGIIYCIVQAINIGFTNSDSIPGSNFDQLANSWVSFTVFISATYPSFIILIVNHQASMSESINSTYEGRGQSGTISTFRAQKEASLPESLDRSQGGGTTVSASPRSFLRFSDGADPEKS